MRTKTRITITLSIIMAFLSALLLLCYFNSTTSCTRASAETDNSFESLIYTDSSAFSFTPISETECSVKLVDKTIENIRLSKSTVINGKEYLITEIESNGFSSNANIKTVILPYISKIKSAAFQNCKNMEIIYAPHVIEIQINAFSFCPKLTDIIFPSTLTTVGSSLFMTNNTKVHARFDEAPSGWSSNWNNGNRNKTPDFNELNENNELWTHDFIFESDRLSTYSSDPVKRLAPLQPYMENESQGNMEITADVMCLTAGAFIGCTFDSFTILESDTPIDIQSSAFVDVRIYNGLTINRDVTYNCEISDTGESVSPFNQVDTPFITLPAPEIIVSGMFMSCTMRNINFITDSGIDYEQDGQVRIPNTTTIIREDAFRGTNNITNLILTDKLVSIGDSAFADWRDNQTIISPYFSLSATDKIFNENWRKDCSANIDFPAQLSVLTCPLNITNNQTYQASYEFKVRKDMYSLSDFTYKFPYTYWNSNTFKDVLDYTVTTQDSEDAVYYTRIWTYNMNVKSSSNGGSQYIQRLQVLIGDIVYGEVESSKVTVHKFIRTKEEFMNISFELSNNGRYAYCLLNDINLGQFTNSDSVWGKGIKGINNYDIIGNNKTITYSVYIDKVEAKTSRYITIFSKNNKHIKDLKIKSTISVLSYGTVVENNTNQDGKVDIGVIAINNSNSGIIDNCHTTLDIEINCPKSTIGGIVAENEGTIKNCTSMGTIVCKQNNTNIGGIVYYNKSKGTISNCVNVANISNYCNSGGIAAQNNGNISGCENRGKITYNYRYDRDGYANYTTGGIVGYNAGNCSNSKNYGTVQFGNYANSSYKYWCVPCMGQIAGESSGTLNNNSWSGTVLSIGLSTNQSGVNQLVYVSLGECGNRL